MDDSEIINEEQKFTEANVKGVYYTFKQSDLKYQDKVIHQLLQKNNDLQDQITQQQLQYELKIKNLEASYEALKELIGNNNNNNKQENKSNYEQLQQTNKYLTCKIQELSQIIEELNEQNDELKNKVELLTKQIELKDISQLHSSRNQIIKDQLIRELQNLKSLVKQSQQQSSPNFNKSSIIDFRHLRDLIDIFVDKTTTLDDCYYTLLERIDQKILRQRMPQLEQLNSQRRETLNDLKQYIDKFD